LSEGSGSRDHPASTQEGGRVARLDAANGFAPWMSAAEMAGSGMSDGEKLAYYAARARAMAEVGINLNHAPVVDLNLNPFNPIIGKSPEIVLRYARLFLRAHRSAGVVTALKHFPGHGSAQGDSRDGQADVSTVWCPAELDPFATLVGDGLAVAIMTSHLQ
jgi:beta-N-acetylhexosaminidase